MALHCLFAIQLIAMGAMEMSGPFWPLYLRTLGQFSHQGLAVASAVAYAGPMVMAMVCTPFWGRLGDRAGHKPMLLRALLALAGTQLWIAFADSAWLVLAIRLLQGGLAGFIAAAQAYGACLVAPGRRGALMARLQAATAIGSVAGPLAGGWLFDVHGFAAVNLVAAVLCLACAVAASLVLPAAAARSRSPSVQHGQAPLLQGVLAGLLLGIVLVQAGKMMPQGFFSLYAEQVLHASKWETGLCYGATAVGLCVAAPLWARCFGQQSRAWVLLRLEWICWACVAIVALQAVSHSIAITLVARLAWGICLAALLPVFYGLLSQEVDTDQQGRALGAGNSAAKAGALIGAGAGGLALAWVPMQYIFWPVAALYAVAAIGMRVIRNAHPVAASVA
jgi:MFS family permease